jgi:hypothetical protein
VWDSKTFLHKEQLLATKPMQGGRHTPLPALWPAPTNTRKSNAEGSGAG